VFTYVIFVFKIVLLDVEHRLIEDILDAIERAGFILIDKERGE